MPWYTSYDDEYGAQEYWVDSGLSGKPGESNMANDAAGLDPNKVVYDSAQSSPSWSYSAPEPVSFTPAEQAEIAKNYPSSVYETITNAASTLGKSAWDAVTSRYKKPDGSIDWGKVAGDGVALYAAKQAYDQASKPVTPTGYQGGIPSYTGVREQVVPTLGLRAGQGGQRYFTDMKYATEAGLPAAQAATAAQATALNERNSTRPVAPATPVNQDPASNTFFGRTPAQPMQAPVELPATPPVGAAGGGLMGYAKGGIPTKPEGTYLSGDTDGMADKIHATIDGKQPARLAHGEFVVPADVVSHLGNGNSDAGAKQLYKMMDRIRMARTGTKQQGKEIDPNKFAPGGIAAYAEGGTVKHFATGDTVPAGATGQESNLSNWVGPYVTNMLGKGAALSEQPYQAYQGPLTAGPSALQTTGFQNAANISTPMGIGQAADTAGGIAGQKQTSSFLAPGTTQAYMNPYTQNVVDIQQQEAQRQADIAATTRHGQQTQAGAFGGSRGAVMDAEAARNLALQQGQIQATGLQSAYDAAAKQFNTEQTTGLAGLNTQLQAAQAQGNLGATQNAAGLANLNAQLNAGSTQQGIEQAGVTADKAAFEAERDNPYKMVQYQQSLLQGLPLNAQSYNITNNPYAAAAGAASAIYNTAK